MKSQNDVIVMDANEIKQIESDERIPDCLGIDQEELRYLHCEAHIGAMSDLLNEAIYADNESLHTPIEVDEADYYLISRLDSDDITDDVPEGCEPIYRDELRGRLHERAATALGNALTAAHDAGVQKVLHGQFADALKILWHNHGHAGTGAWAAVEHKINELYGDREDESLGGSEIDTIMKWFEADWLVHHVD